MSHEYLSALAIVIVGVLSLFKVESTPEQVLALLSALLGAYNMYRRHKKGDINALGVKK